MSEWKESELEEVIECLIDYRGKTPKKTKIGVPLITAKIIKGGAISTPDEFIADSDYDSWMVRGYPQKGDVVLTTEAPLGEVAQLDNKKIALAQRVVCLRGKKDILDNTYLKYYFISKRGHTALTSKGTGTTVIGIKQSELRKVNVVYPPLPTQRRIAAILSSLDAKIENNNKVNAKLEEIAQNLFKEWFVDFGPFKNGKFVDSELGPIPEGWRVGTLGEIASNVTDGVHNSVKDDASSSYYLLSCKNIKGGKLTIDNKERTISEDTFKQLRKRTKLAKGDILLSSVGTIGEVMLLNENPTNYEFQRSVAIVKPKDGISSSEFIYETFVVRNVELRHLAHGAVQQCIFLSDLVNFNVLIPPYSIIEIFTNKSKSLFEKISLNYEENQRLATLRDTLLPKLMSGEIKV